MNIKINESNGRLLDSAELSIHDDILVRLQYDRKTRELLLKMKSHQEKEYRIRFVYVMCFEMTSCDFWGESPFVLDMEYVEPESRTLLPRIFNIQKQYPDDFSTSPLNNGLPKLESKIMFSSGDFLIVACESILFEEL